MCVFLNEVLTLATTKRPQGSDCLTRQRLLVFWPLQLPVRKIISLMEREREIERWREKARKITENCMSHLVYSQVISIPIWFKVPCSVIFQPLISRIHQAMNSIMKVFWRKWRVVETSCEYSFIPADTWEELHIWSLRYDSLVEDMLTENDLDWSKKVFVCVCVCVCGGGGGGGGGVALIL